MGKEPYGVTADEFPLKGDLDYLQDHPSMFQQGYSLFYQQDWRQKVLPLTEQITLESLGYRPYSTLFITQKMIDENPELVQKVIDQLRKSFVKSLNDPKTNCGFYS